MSTHELMAIRDRMVELDEQFHALPLCERTGERAKPVRLELAELDEQASRLMFAPELPPGFRWDHEVRPGEAVHGFRILPDANADPDLWGKVICFEDAEAVLSPFGLEVRPTYGDFFLAVKGTNHVRYVGRRVRLVGPVGHFDQVAHLFTMPGDLPKDRA